MGRKTMTLSDDGLNEREYQDRCRYFSLLERCIISRRSEARCRAQRGAFDAVCTEHCMSIDLPAPSPLVYLSCGLQAPESMESVGGESFFSVLASVAPITQ